MHLPADLKPADRTKLRNEHLPSLPSWYPLDPIPTPENPHPAKYSDVERALLRHRKAVQEASAGPYDDTRLAVYFPDGGTPPTEFRPASSPHVVYLLDPAASSQWRLTYRYSPDSPVHRESMRAVTEAYAEYGRDYTVLAREESDEERHAPEPTHFL